MIGDWIDKVDYPQLPAMTDKELESFLEEAQFSRLGTLNEDGSIHIAPIFFKYEDGQILMATQDPSRKIRNIKRNPNVTVLIDTTEVPFQGALIYGRAELDYEDVYGLTKEVKEKLTRVKPLSLGQASRISGVTPAALMALQVHFKKMGI